MNTFFSLIFGSETSNTGNLVNKRSFKIVFICMLFVLFSGCGNKDEDSTDKCGAPSRWAQDIIPFSTSEVQGSHLYIYYEDPNTPIDICPDGEVLVNFQVKLVHDRPLIGVNSIQGKLYWGLGEKRYLTLTYEHFGSQYSGLIKADLKPFFGEAPGWIGASIIFDIPSTYTPSAGDAFIRDSTMGFIIGIQYNQF